MASLQTFEKLKQISRESWTSLSSASFPFTDYEYLLALEDTGCVGGQAGWLPLYITSSEHGRIEGASFLYAKDNSYGEYIFDWAWAQAYAQHGLAYYPKLVSAVPFTPATGPKLLFPVGADRPAVASKLIRAARQTMETLAASSLHYLFLDSQEVPYFEREGFLIRHSFQYHWNNRGYASFEDFLATLKSRKRKQILKERQELQTSRLRFSWIRGPELTQKHAQLFYRFYEATIQKMEAISYLTPEFFARVFQTMQQEIVLVLAEEEDHPIAGALFYEKGDTLYGRYWGATKEVRNLHFELCYYQPLAYAIAKGLRRFEAGAQGEHKIARGFIPTLTYSAHWIHHPLFREAIARYIDEEKQELERLMAELREHSPYGAR